MREPGRSRTFVRDLDQRASQRRDHRTRGVRRRFRVLGVGPAQDIARIFHDRVLEAAAGAEERERALAREADRPQRACHAAIRAGRHAPERVERRQHGVAVDRLRRQPAGFERRAEGARGERERARNGLMGSDAGIVVADETDEGRGLRSSRGMTLLVGRKFDLTGDATACTCRERVTRSPLPGLPLREGTALGRLRP